jgi:mannose-6-phosphate isomerase-like protein (cupin superfamily)
MLHVPASEGEQWWVVGDTYTVKATAADTGGRLAFFEATVPPNAGPPPHVHRREDEFYYVLAGELDVFEDEECLTATPGSFIFVPRGTVHYFRNRTTNPVRMTVGITPAGFEEFFFAVGQRASTEGSAPALGPEEMARTLELAPRFGMEVRVPKVDEASPPIG